MSINLSVTATPLRSSKMFLHLWLKIESNFRGEAFGHPTRISAESGRGEGVGGERVVGCRKASNSVGDDSHKFVGATVIPIP